MVMNPGKLASASKRLDRARQPGLADWPLRTDTPSEYLLEFQARNRIFGAAIKIKGCQIGRWWALYSLLFQPAKFWREGALRPFVRSRSGLRNVLFQIAVIFLCPDVRIGAGVDRLCLYVKPGSGLADAAFQYAGITPSSSPI